MRIKSTKRLRARADNTQSNDVETRIASIVSQRDQAQTNAASLLEQNKTLATRLAILEDQLATFATRSTPGSQIPAKPEIPPASIPKSSSDTPDIASMVRGIVQDAIKPITERFDQTEAKQALQLKQKQAFTIAASQCPDLADPESDLSQTVERLWQGRPDLAGLPDAPIVLTNIARGILADARRADVKQVEQKKQANILKPAPTSARVNNEPPNERAELAKTVREEASQQGTTGAGGADLFANLFRASLTDHVVENQQRD